MLKRITTNLLKKVVLIVMTIGMGITGVGCNNQQKYINAALNQLEEKYGEEFELRELGGGFGATRDTFKLICNPKNDKNKTFDVEVGKDLTLYGDSYIGRLMDEKLEKILYEPTSELFGKDIIIKSSISGHLTKFNSLDMDVLEYLKENSNINLLLTIFIESDKEVDEDKESKLIYEYMSRILDMGIENGKGVRFFYVNTDCYNNIENTYYEQYYNAVTEMIRYYKSYENSYSSAYCSDTDGKHDYTIEDIKISFEKNKQGRGL